MKKQTKKEKKAYWAGYEHGRQGALLQNIIMMQSQLKDSQIADKENENDSKN